MEYIKDKKGGNHMDIEDMIVDLNDLTQDGVIECPYCHKCYPLRDPTLRTAQRCFCLFPYAC